MAGYQHTNQTVGMMWPANHTLIVIANGTISNCRTMTCGHFYPFRSRCCDALLPLQKDNSAYTAHTWTYVHFCSKAILLRHSLGRIKDGSLTYPARPISVAGTTNTNKYSFHTRKLILIPYWLTSIRDKPLTYLPRPVREKTDNVECSMCVYCVLFVQGTTGVWKHPQPWHRVQRVRVYMNSSNDSPVVLYFDTVSTPHDNTLLDT